MSKSAINDPVAVPLNESLKYKRVLFATCPTGLFCREDRCQSFFEFELIPSMRPPLEECEAGGALLAVGAEHRIIDGPAEKLTDQQFLARIEAVDADLIVLAVTFGSLDADLLWALRIRQRLPEVPIGLRGAPCYVWDEQILRSNPAVDFCVQGDYEVTFRELATKGLADASGVVARLANGAIRKNPPRFEQNLDQLPLPNRDQINSHLYTVRGSKSAQATIHVQRGCPFPCTFCLAHTVSGNKARHRSAASIAQEMKDLIGRGITHFYLRAETFTVNKKWAIDLSQTLARECPEARWVTATRVECVDDETIAALKSGGCYGISFGVDVASKKIGEKVKKPPQLDKAREAMRLCDKYGIISLAYFMIGFVWDDEATLKETANFVRNIRPDLITIHYAHPYPGTPYYEAVKAEKVPVVSSKAQSHPALNLEGLSSQMLTRFTQRLLIKHYSRPAVVVSILRKMACNKLSAFKHLANGLAR